MTTKPVLITLMWCDSCGGDDRWSTLRHGHYKDGFLCNGNLRQLTYKLDGAS